MRIEALIETLPPAVPGQERVVVVGGSAGTLDLLRLATVRSENVVLLTQAYDEAVGRYARHFAVSIELRQAEAEDFREADLAIIATEDARQDARALRLARRHGVPAHVWGQVHLSDFSLIAMLEWHPSSVRRRRPHLATVREAPVARVG